MITDLFLNTCHNASSLPLGYHSLVYLHFRHTIKYCAIICPKIQIVCKDVPQINEQKVIKLMKNSIGFVKDIISFIMT